MNRKNLIFCEDNDSKIIVILNTIITLWYFIDVGLFFILGFTESTGIFWQNIFSGLILLGWWIICDILFILSRSKMEDLKHFALIYILGVFFLSIIEETVIYYNGGGLGGKALNLWHDLFLAVPVFVGIGVGIAITNKFFKIQSGEFFLLGAIQGLIIEIFSSGNLGSILLLGGSALGIYGAMMGALAKNNDKEERKISKLLLILIIGTVMTYIFVIIGAIVGDNLYRAFIA